VLLERFHELEIHHVTTPEDAAAFEAGFVQSYCRVFSGEPYFEAFTVEEATQIWRRLTTTRHHITLVAVDAAGAMQGFGISIPLSEAPDAARHLTGMLPAKATMYLVELGVDPAWRGKRLGKHLVKLRIQLTDPELYSQVVLRVAEGRTDAFEMYRSFEFTDMGVSMTVTHRRTDGSVKGDVRYFMSKVLSQVRFDE
jgi:ribosomal protein S18 acetylase RimI-like enzyme